MIPVDAATPLLKLGVGRTQPVGGATRWRASDDVSVKAMEATAEKTRPVRLDLTPDVRRAT
jgi:hypothetical protein